MANIVKPKYDTRSQVYNSNLVQPAKQQVQDLSEVDTSEAKVWEAVTSGINVFAELFEKSSLASDKIQAKSLMIDKIEHTQKLSQLLKLHLAKTDPSQIKLGEVLDKLKNRQLKIGENLDIDISPLELPDDINERVKGLIDVEYLRMDGALYNSVLEETEKAQTAQDNIVLNKELTNLGEALTSVLAEGHPENEKIDSGIFNQLLESAFITLDDRESYGSFDKNEIALGKERVVQQFLKQKFHHDLRKDRDGTIEKAGNGYYKWTGSFGKLGVPPSKDNTSTTISMSPDLYHNEFMSFQIREFNKNEIKTKEKNELQFEKFKGSYAGLKYSGGTNTEMMKELGKLGIPEYRKEQWLNIQNASLAARNLAKDKANTQETKRLADRNAQDELQKISNLSLRNQSEFESTYTTLNFEGQIISKSNAELKEITGHDYITTKYIDALIASNENADRQKTKEESRIAEANKNAKTILNQKAFLSTSMLSVGNVESASFTTEKYGKFHANGEVSINMEAVNADEEFVKTYPNPKERRLAAEKILHKALSTIDTDWKQEQAKEKREEVTPNAQERILFGIGQRAASSLGKTDEIVATEPYRDKSPKPEQLTKYNSVKYRVNTIKGIGERVASRTPDEIISDLDKINKLDSDAYTTVIANPVKNILQKRQKEMQENHLGLAFQESGEINNIGKDYINWDNVDKWYKEHNLSRGGQLVPNIMKEQYKKGITEAKNYINMRDVVEGIKEQYGLKHGEKALWEVQQELPPELSALLDIDIKNINSIAPYFEYLQSSEPADRTGYNKGNRSNVDDIISETLENSFPAQFESQRRKGNHAKLIRFLVDNEVNRSGGEYNENTVNRVVNDLYGQYTAVRTGSSAKLVFPNNVLRPYNITSSMIRGSKPWFVLQKQQAGMKIGIKGLNENQNKTMMMIAESVLEGNGNMDWGVINGKNGGTRVVLMHFPSNGDMRLGKIVADVTANGEPINYTQEESVKNFASQDVHQFGDAQNDLWDKVEGLGLEADFSREKFLDYLHNKEKYMKVGQHLGGNFLDSYGSLRGSLTREGADPGRREMEMFFIPLGEKIVEFENRNNRHINNEELEELYGKELAKHYDYQYQVTININKWLSDYVTNFNKN